MRMALVDGHVPSNPRRLPALRLKRKRSAAAIFGRVVPTLPSPRSPQWPCGRREGGTAEPVAYPLSPAAAVVLILRGIEVLRSERLAVTLSGVLDRVRRALG